MSFITALFVALLDPSPGPIPGDVPVKIVDAKQQPVAGAWIASFFASGTGFRASEFGEQGIDAIQRWIERGGNGAPSEFPEWTASDADGRASVRVDTFWDDLVAVTPTLSGHAIFARGTVAKGDVVEIVVRPHRFWRVPVVDGADPKVKPVVDVEFGTEGDLSDRASFHRITVRTTAGQENVAALGPIDLLFDPLEIDPTLVARLDLPIEPAPRLRIRASQFGEKAAPPPPLIVPAHGTIEVHVVDRSGKVVTQPGFVTVKRDPDARCDSIRWLNSDFGTWRRPTRDGVAIFDFVGLGAMLVLQDQDGQSFRDVRAPPIPFDQIGPIAPLVAAGERRVLTLPAPEPARREIVVRGRAVSSAGGALTQHALSVELLDARSGEWLDRNPFSGSELVVTADGEFTATLVVEKQGPRPAVLVVGDAGPIGQCSHEPSAIGSFAIPDLPTWSGGDVGDVVVEPLPLLASGRAVDEGGAPIPELKIAVECDEDAMQRDPAVPAWWSRSSRSLTVMTERDGRFEVRGFGRGLPCKLGTESDEFWSQRNLPITGGVSDLVVRCEHGRNRWTGGFVGQVAGSLLLDPDVPRHVIEVTIDAQVVGHERGISLDGRHGGEPGDRFGNDGVPTGTWTVTATFRDFGCERAVLAKIPNVRVQSGKTTTLPPIDLRGRIKVKRLALRNQDGTPIMAGHVIAQPSKDPADHSGCEFTCFHEGESVLCTVDRWPRFDFLAADCRRVTRRFEDARAETIVLPPAIRVHLVLPENLRLPPAPLTLDVNVGTDEILPNTYVARASQPASGDRATFGATAGDTHAVDLRLPAAGHYTLKVGVSHREVTANSSSWRGSDVHSQQFTFADTDAPFVIDLEVTQAEIDAAVKQLGF